MAHVQTVMISSTVKDLQDHRGVVMDAVLRMGMRPRMMEHLPATDADAVAVSLAMVEEADLYLGVFGYRYGYVPGSHDRSITEIEYDRAVARNIPRLIFLMHEQHPVTIDQVEFEHWPQLVRFKARISTERVLRQFRSAEELRSEILHGLAEYRPRPPVSPFMAPAPDDEKLVGRDELLATLHRDLVERRTRARALWGLPGVGKTAIAVALAHDAEVRRVFADGVLWASLGRSPDVLAIFRRWSDRLDIRREELSSSPSAREMAGAISDVIGGRSMLLVVDGAWTAEAALMFKIGGPDCVHLLTTRQAEAASQFAGSNITDVRELDAEPALALLQHLAPDAIAQNRQRAGELVALLGGLPLGIKLLGRYLAKVSHGNDPFRIGAAFDRLIEDAGARLAIDAPAAPGDAGALLPEHATVSLAAVVAASDEALAPDSRQAFHRLAVFPPKPGSFSLAAALDVSGAPPDAIYTLVDSGLLDNVEPGRFALHPIVRDYARMRMADGAPYEQFVRFFVAWAVERRDDARALDAELSNLTLALVVAIDRTMRTELVRGAVALAPFLESRGLYEQARGYLHAAEAAARSDGDDAGLAHALCHLGRIAEKAGEYGRARTLLQEALDLVPRNDERRAAVLYGLSVVEYNEGNYRSARLHLEEGLQLASTTRDPALVADLRQRLGLVMRELGDLASARDHANAGLALAERMEGSGRIPMFLTDLAVLDLRDGEIVRAAQRVEEGLRIARLARQSERIAGLLQLSAIVAAEQRQFAKAESDLGEAIALARQISHQWYVTSCLIDAGRLQLRQQRRDEAVPPLIEARSLARAIGSKDLEAFASFALAQAVRDDDEAHACGTDSLRLLTEIGHGAVEDVRSWLEEWVRSKGRLP
jgi:tetratricopeptide (TPR) repeat protein